MKKQAKSTEGTRSQRMYESKVSSEMSRDSQKVQGRSRTEEGLRSERAAAAAKTHQQERDKRDSRENEPKHHIQSSGYHQEKRGDTSFRESWRNEEPHYERGRRGRGRGRGRNQPDLEDYKPPSTSDKFQRSSFHESHDERGRGRRGRGRGGRRGRQNADDGGDAYQPSRPSAGHSLGDWFDQKLVLNEKPSYLSKYQDDYYYSNLYYGWEEPYDGSHSHEDSRNNDKPRPHRKGGLTESRAHKEYPPMTSKSSKKSLTKQATSQRGHKYSEDKGRTGKEAWPEEDYPSMPSRPSMKKPMSQPQAAQSEAGGGGGGGGHWDWVSLAAGSSAPSSARKRTADS